MKPKEQDYGVEGKDMRSSAASDKSKGVVSSHGKMERTLS